MIPITGDFTEISTDPALTVNYAYEYKRKNGKVYYRIGVYIDSLDSEKYFPYNLKTDIIISGKKIVDCGEVKASKPSNWNEALETFFPGKNAWYELDSDSNPVRFTARVYSTQTNGSSSGTGLMYFSDDVPNIRVKCDNVWRKAKNVFVKVNNTWKSVKKLYLKTDKTWKVI